MTPPLLRAAPHRHSISHTPAFSVRPSNTLTSSTSPSFGPRDKIMDAEPIFLSSTTFPSDLGTKQSTETKTEEIDVAEKKTPSLSTESVIPSASAPQTSVLQQSPVVNYQAVDTIQPNMNPSVLDNLGARPKTTQFHFTAGVSEVRSQEGILLKQASWGSRMKPREKKPVEKNFARNRELWEKRSSRPGSVLSGDDDYDLIIEATNSSMDTRAVSNNPDQPRLVLQTPDLVLDIPPGALADSPTVPLHRLSRSSRSPSSESITSTTSESSSSVSMTIADTFASVSDTIKKINTESNLIPRNLPQSEVIPIRPKTPQPVSQEAGQVLMSTSSTFKPVLRVKPVQQTKPDETAED
eukprot:TRINITY_DN15247_c0_g1_i3.p1 TRINITY_DN15247_c0_g1~~TRINITY_DN15247_c0_g1_i3.p1  ORF type:complete len:384 (-),score=106.08 TRINITY_DN15247_c0_g1_i3:140-1198(-)